MCVMIGSSKLKNDLFTDRVCIVSGLTRKRSRISEGGILLMTREVFSQPLIGTDKVDRSSLYDCR